MTTTNPNLKCKNTLIQELNKSYFVMPNFNGETEIEKNTFIVGGIENYICSVVPCKYNGQDGVTWYGKVYTDTTELLKDVNEYNSHLEFPSYTYHPMFTTWAQIEKQVHWYVVDKLKCEHDWEGQRYNLKTNAGDILVSLSFDVSMEQEESKRHNFISFYVGRQCYTMKFKDAHEACGYINAFVMAEVSGYFAGTMGVLDVLKDVTNFGDLSNIKTIDVKAMSVVSAKEMIVNRLETILAMLK